MQRNKIRTMDRLQWIDAFVMRLNQLGGDCEPHVLAEIAEDHHPEHGITAPNTAVDHLVAEWGGVPQHD